MRPSGGEGEQSTAAHQCEVWTHSFPDTVLLVFFCVRERTVVSSISFHTSDIAEQIEWIEKDLQDLVLTLILFRFYSFILNNKIKVSKQTWPGNCVVLDSNFYFFYYKLGELFLVCILGFQHFKLWIKKTDIKETVKKKNTAFEISSCSFIFMLCLLCVFHCANIKMKVSVSP